MISGALSLVQTALAAGIEICFANPGTTEMPLLLALEEVPRMRVVLGLFEGVCTGAADGWGRMTGRPAATLLHLGPGLSNGLANLHNARRARAPIVNWIGDHATHHRQFDAPLATDIRSLAATVGWVREVTSASQMASASLAAVNAALGPPAQVASLVLPSDCQWLPGDCCPDPPFIPAGVPRPVEDLVLSEARRRLDAPGAGLLIGGNALSAAGVRAASRIAASTGCSVWVETFAARRECGRHLPSLPVLPYFPEAARKELGHLAALVLAGARDPVAFFAYPGQPSRLCSDQTVICPLAHPDDGIDAALALEQLADDVDPGGRRRASTSRPVAVYRPTSSGLDPETLGRALASLIPEHSIVVNEGATTGMLWNQAYAADAVPHTALNLTGGSIGQGLPNALGASLACPDRRVIAFQADGSGLYTLQALWSMAREAANVTVVICANQRYKILQAELARATNHPTPRALTLTDLRGPEIDWTDLAKGFGVPAQRVTTENEFAETFVRNCREPGPNLIEARLG